MEEDEVAKTCGKVVNSLIASRQWAMKPGILLAINIGRMASLGIPLQNNIFSTPKNPDIVEMGSLDLQRGIDERPIKADIDTQPPLLKK